VGKQRKPPGHDHDTSGPAEAALTPQVDPLLVEQGVLGNAALQERLGGGLLEAAEQQLGASTRSAAATMARQARVALLLHPRPAEEQARLLAIVEGSALSADRKEALVERLTEQQAVALEAQAAVGATLGPIDEESRASWVQALESAETLLGPQSGTDPVQAVAEAVERSGLD
jgi:hypothetical protein